MEELDYWRLCEELNIVQASLLVIGVDPSCAEYTEEQEIKNRPQGYEAAKTAICSGLKNFVRYEKEASEFRQRGGDFYHEYDHLKDMMVNEEQELKSLLNRVISGTLVEEDAYDDTVYIGRVDGSVDLYKSMVNVESLKEWLRLKGFTTGFFFPEPMATMDFLDPLNPRYAPQASGIR